MMRRLSLLLFALTALVLAALMLAPWLEAGLLLRDLARGVQAGEVSRGVDEGGDLYRGARSPRAGIVLLPGVSPQGKDDPRLVRFAEAIAAAQFLVLVPDLPSLRALQVSAGDADEVAAAARWLRGRGLPVGLGAFSYAVGPALLAALELGPHAAFVLAIGGYHDLTRVVRHFTTGEAGRRAKWLFVLSNVGRLERPEERQALTVMSNRKLADESADVADLMGDLGPDGRAVVALVMNRDPARVAALLDALPATIRSELHALDLARRDLGTLSARLLLVHGRDDPVLPAGESVTLAAAAPDARLFLLDDLRHVDAGWTLRDGFTMLRAARELLRLRDSAVFR